MRFLEIWSPVLCRYDFYVCSYVCSYWSVFRTAK